MYFISNSQRDSNIRYIDILCEKVDGRDTRSCETRRLVKNLKSQLLNKQPFDASIMRKLQKEIASKK